MNIRSLTRGDGVVIGAAVLLFIASFLNFYDSNYVSGTKAWDILGVVMSIHIAGVIAAALIVVSHAVPQTPKKIAGLDLGQFGVALAIFAAWTSLWYLLGNGTAGSGQILGFLGSAVLAGAAVATPLVPALKVGLVGAPKPVAPQPYGGAPGTPGGPGYGYPGGQQPYGAQPQPGTFGADAQGAQAGQPGGPAQGGAAPAGDFAPFWFAVPVARPLFGEDGSPTPIAELAPGTWYLAVEQRGASLVAQTQDGQRGVLQDTSGIQRG
ncbi:hypothetical protein AB0O07_13140 [Streptomyces sp. NPDC093085]|uniref:hypothetical protein n=1 Tax=Streptomyces sp. NPDC093085 TaxID=3155068 RepID=UPI00341ABB20